MIAPRFAVLGGGSWGTALAILLARGGRDVTLWMRDDDLVASTVRDRTNARYLPGIQLPDALSITSDLGEALALRGVVVGAVPSAATAELVRAAAASVMPGATWVSATKGLDPRSQRRMSEVVAEGLPRLEAVAVLSGPSFAAEVALGHPTAVAVACEQLEVARRVQALVSGPTFRAYASADVVGVELAGALKNIVAIAAGMLSGLELGHDPLAALVTRGLREITGLAVALGAQPATMTGLAGLGDLVLTCTGSASRNRRLGEMLARGLTLEEARARLGHVAEGVATTERALDAAARHGREVPIIEAVGDVLFNGASVPEVVSRLMQRSLKDETPW